MRKLFFVLHNFCMPGHFILPILCSILSFDICFVFYITFESSVNTESCVHCHSSQFPLITKPTIYYFIVHHRKAEANDKHSAKSKTLQDSETAYCSHITKKINRLSVSMPHFRD